jgi:site-specific DNA recombinase
VRTWREAREHDGSVTEDQVRTALTEFGALWDDLFPAEQSRIIQLLVERVDVGSDGADIRMRTEGLTNLIADLRAIRPTTRRAA